MTNCLCCRDQIPDDQVYCSSWCAWYDREVGARYRARIAVLEHQLQLAQEDISQYRTQLRLNKLTRMYNNASRL